MIFKELSRESFISWSEGIRSLSQAVAKETFKERNHLTTGVAHKPATDMWLFEVKNGRRVLTVSHMFN